MRSYRFENGLTMSDYLPSTIVFLLKPAVQAIYIILSFLFAWALCASVMDDPSVTLGVFILAFCFYVFLSVVFLALVCYRNKKNWDTIEKVLGYRSSEINEESYLEFYNESTSTVKWEEFYKIQERKEYFFLYALKKKFIILPKRLLPEGCADLLREKAAVLQGRPAGGKPTTEAQAEPEVLEDGSILTYRKPEDNTAFQLYHSYIFRKNLIVNSALILFFTLIMVYLGTITGEYYMPFIFLAIIVVIHALTILGVMLSSKKLKKEPLRVVYRFRENGFVMDHKFGKTFVEWSKLYAARQTSKHYFLYLSKAQAAVVPKRYLSDETIQLLNDAIQKYNLREKKLRAQ